MKAKITVVCVVVCLFLGFGRLVSFAADSQSGSASSFETSRDWKKLSDDIQQAWLAAKKSGDFSLKLECFLVLTEIANDGDQSFLFDAGFSTQIATGTVVRGHMKVEALPKVAGQYFVREIKLAGE